MDSDGNSSEDLGGQKNSSGTNNSPADSGIIISLHPAVEPDLIAINEIYNYYVLNSTATYQEQPEALCDRYQWFHNHDERYPVLVAEHSGEVVGWGSISRYHERTAYRYTVENSIYVHHNWHRRGIGSLLLQDIIRRSKNLGYRAIIGAIDSDQTRSIRLHAKFNFQHVGRLQNVGMKFGRWLDVIYMELLLPK
jgi:phosphinothricin acetyltransferase